MDKYLIDGYNFLFRTSGKGSSLEKKRQALLELLNEELAPLRLNVSIVFDGADPIRRYAQSGQYDSLEVVYTSDDQNADEYLIERVQRAKHPTQYVLVTSDRALAQSCRSLGARTFTIEAFLQFIEKKQKSMQNKEVKAAFRLPSREMKRLLEIFEKKLRDIP